MPQSSGDPLPGDPYEDLPWPDEPWDDAPPPEEMDWEPQGAGFEPPLDWGGGPQTPVTA